MRERVDVVLGLLAAGLFLLLSACIGICFLPATPLMIPGLLERRRRRRGSPSDIEGQP